MVTEQYKPTLSLPRERQLQYCHRDIVDSIVVIDPRIIKSDPNLNAAPDLSFNSIPNHLRPRYRIYFHSIGHTQSS